MLGAALGPLVAEYKRCQLGKPHRAVMKLDGCFHSPWSRSPTMTLWQAAGGNHHPGSLVTSRSTVRLSNPLERCCPDTLHSGREPAVSPRYLLLQ
jgi:hypothetical protein